MNLLLRLLNGIDRPRLRVALAVLLAALASGASVGLMGTSAWMLSRAAELPPEHALALGAVGVRFFGISRGVFRYVERLVGHDLGLRLQSALRLQTYERLAGTTLLGRRRGDLLTRVVADVEAILDLVVRVTIPLASGGIVILGTTAILGTFNAASAGVLLLTSVLAASRRRSPPDSVEPNSPTSSPGSRGRPARARASETWPAVASRLPILTFSSIDEANTWASCAR